MWRYISPFEAEDSHDADSDILGACFTEVTSCQSKDKRHVVLLAESDDGKQCLV